MDLRMTPEDFKLQVVPLMESLFDVSKMRLIDGEKVNRPMVDVWMSALSDFTTSTVMNALRVYARTTTTGYAPRPANIAAICRNMTSEAEKTCEMEQDLGPEIFENRSNTKAMISAVAELSDDEISDYISRAITANPNLRNIRSFGTDHPVVIAVVYDMMRRQIGPSQAVRYGVLPTISGTIVEVK